MTILFEATFESGSDEVTINPVTEGFSVGSGTLVYDASTKAHGELSAKITPSSNLGYLQWDASSFPTQAWGRAYVLIDQTIDADTHLVGFWDGGLQKASIVAKADGRLSLRNSSTSIDRIITGVLWSPVIWMRLEWRINYTTDEFELWVYITDVDGNTEDAHISIDPAVGIPKWQFINFGMKYSSAGNEYIAHWDNIAISLDAKIGPSAVEPPEPAEVKYLWAGGVTSGAVRVAAQIDNADSVQVAYAPDTGGDPLTGTPSVSTTVALDGFGIAQIPLSGLASDTAYIYGVKADGALQSTRGRFKTMPTGQSNFTVAFSSGQAAASDHTVFDRIVTEAPRFFFHLGDLYPAPVAGNDVTAARAKYNAQLQAGTGKFKNLLLHVPTDYLWGTTDWGGADSGSTYVAAPALKSVRQQYVPAYPNVDPNSAPYHSVGIGRVQFLVLDVRSRRTTGTILGDDQKTWLKDQLSSSAYPVKVIVCPIPWRAGTEWDAAPAELAEINTHITSNSITNVLMVGAAYALAADSGANSSVARANLLAGALDGVGSGVVGTWNQGENPNAVSAGQYALLSVTDTGTQITLTYSGRNQAGTVLVGPFNVVLTIPVSDEPQTKIWNGTEWVLFRPRVYLGGVWEEVPVKIYEGSTWLTL
jgi:hypothetical protein